MSHLVHVQITRRLADSHDDDMRVGYVYVLVDGDGHVRYAGHTTLTEEARLCNHAKQARHDSTSSPLYRLIASTGGIEGWSIRTIRTLEYDAVRLPDALLACEGETMDQLRAAGYALVNHNRPICADQAQRARMKRWRDEHPGYMAAKGREHRQRRRAQREAAAAAAAAAAVVAVV
jgi:hypothetical protein